MQDKTTVNNGCANIEDFDIDRIRSVCGKLAKNINWQKLRGTMPYDWNTYGGLNFHKLIDLLRIDFDGSIKSKDKRGHWRVMNEVQKVGESA